MDTIQQLTGFSEEERSQMMYNNGLQYLSICCRGVDEIADEISGTKAFWSWWKHHWNLRDQVYAESFNRLLKKGNEINKQLSRRIYSNTHCAIALSCELNMNAVALQDSYALMVEKLHHEIKTTA